MSFDMTSSYHHSNISAKKLFELLNDAIKNKTAACDSYAGDKGNLRNYQCKSDGCFRKAYASGYCNAHYIRKRKGKDLNSPLRARKRDDLCVECNEKTGAKGGWGLCSKHYKRARSILIKDTLIAAFGGACSKCDGIFHRAVFDFHHIGGKDASPSVLISNSNLETIAFEISKCILLCANCHRLEHHDGI